MRYPEPENVADVCAMALALAQFLNRELVRLDGPAAAARTKLVYDAMYLPLLILLSDYAARYVESEDWQLLCQALQEDLADTQLCIVIEILDCLQLDA
jgi:hypothetical protein